MNVVFWFHEFWFFIHFPDVINVTIPVQCLVEEQSKLILYEGSKNSLAGFYDPCSDEDKHLLVHYLYQGKHHQILVPDEDQVRCPRLSHQMPNQWSQFHE